MNKKKSIFLISIIFILGCLYSVSRNVDILLFISDVSGSQSVISKISLNRVYKLSSNKKDVILSSFRDEDKINLIHYYIRVVGVSGYIEAKTDLMNLYIETQEDDRRRGDIVGPIISSMGLIEDKLFVSLLETLLRNYEQHDVRVSQYWIARSLYLLTGKQYTFVDKNGVSQELYMSSELISIKEVLEKSHGRDRTYKEKLIIDQLFLPPTD